MFQSPRRWQHRPCPAARGMVTVEFALTVPILFLLFFGAIEFGRANMLMHTTTIAATEGARRGIISGTTAEEVRQAVEAEMNVIGVTDVSIVVDPSVITSDTEVIAVGIGVPVNMANGYILPRFFLGKNFVKVASMTREAKPSDTNATQIIAAQARAKQAVNAALAAE